MELKYRPEIDGLRTIAVLSVIIYHAEFSYDEGLLLPGGFFGVDVFFVISGFLITSLIMSEQYRTGSFSISRFYERRARRLLPALLTVILVSIPFAWKFLLPEQHVDYAKSLIASLLFGSNIYWHDSLLQYGAEAGLFKPFLHTWSLAVEEQYYIIFPLILLAIFKWSKNNTIVILSAGFLLSLEFSNWITPQYSSFSFYMLPSRFWELLAGSILANILHFHPQKENDALLNRTMPVLGLFFIIHSILFIDFNAVHPGYITLLPVLGTVFIIWFSNGNDLVTKVLSSKLFISIGLVSYSLYLWHYPIFAFLRIDGNFESPGKKVLGIILTFLFSFVSYKLIEKPFRSSRTISNKIFIPVIFSLSLSVGIYSYWVVLNEGFSSRFQGQLASGVAEMREFRNKYWGDHSAYTRVKDFTSDKVSIEVIGNSWGQDVANALIESGLYQVSFNGSTSHKCKAITLTNVEKSDKEYAKWKNRCAKNINKFKADLSKAQLVIIANRKNLLNVENNEITSELLGNIRLLRNNDYNGPVLLITNRPLYRKHVFKIIREFGFGGEGVNLYAQKYLVESISLLKKSDETAKDFYAKHNLHYYSFVDSLCDDKICMISDDQKPLYFDSGHFTLSGTKYVSKNLSHFINSEILTNKEVRRESSN
jgi:peptidoglycan/LPS O-acetylase OafA/YrhL